MLAPIKPITITQPQLLTAIVNYIPALVAASFFNKSSIVRTNTEMVVVLSRDDPARISIKLREEKIINLHTPDVAEYRLAQIVTDSLMGDKIGIYSRNAVAKIEKEVVNPMIDIFYSSQKLTTVDAVVRFRSGVIGSITIKTEISGY